VGAVYPLDQRVLRTHPHPNPPPQAGEGADFRRRRKLITLWANETPSQTGILLASSCAAASISGTPGPPRSKSTIVADPGLPGSRRPWAGPNWSLSLGSNGLVSLDPSAFRGSRSSKASIFAGRRGFATSSPYLNTFLRPPPGQKYVGSLSCLAYGPACLAFGRDPMARFQATPANSEKVHIHSPLREPTDLARHLNSSAAAVPA
jgi:hypothetical protein